MRVKVERVPLSESAASQPIGSLTIRSFPNPDVEKLWRGLLERADLPSHYTSPEFFLEKRFMNCQPFAVLSVAAVGMATGVLTGMHERGQTVSGLPVRSQILLDQGSDKRGAVRALMTGLLKEARSSNLVEVSSWEPLGTMDALRFRIHHLDGPVILDLSQPLDSLFKQLNSKRRNNIRFAMKNNVEFAEVKEQSAFSAYYHDVYSHWRDTARKRIMDPATTFEDYERRFHLNGNRKLFVAKVEGKTVAGAFLRFYPGGLVEYSANSSLDEYLRLKPNEFIQWRAIEWAKNHGFKAYSLGGAGKFHREFGGVVVPAYRYWRDQTFLRRYALKNDVRKFCRTILDQMPLGMAQAVRRFKNSRPSFRISVPQSVVARTEMHAQSNDASQNSREEK